MKLYYINVNPNQDGNHPLHTANCHQLPNIFNRACLGSHNNSQEAHLAAKKKYSKATFCPNCLSSQDKPQKPLSFYKKWFGKE